MKRVAKQEVKSAGENSKSKSYCKCAGMSLGI